MESGNRLVSLQGEIHTGAGLGVWPGTVGAYQFLTGKELQGLGHAGLFELTAAAGGDHLGRGRALHDVGGGLAGAELRRIAEGFGHPGILEALEGNAHDAVVEVDVVGDVALAPRMMRVTADRELFQEGVPTGA